MNNEKHIIAKIPEMEMKEYDKECVYIGRIMKKELEKLKNKVPNAKIEEKMGEIKCPLTQLKAHLMYCGLNDHVISEMKNNSVIECWEPNEDELKGRRSFLDDLVITIDPESASDFDDALSIKECDDGSYQVIKYF